MTQIKEPPCRGCEYQDYPKMGKFVSMDENRMPCTPHKYMKDREMKPNPCYDCALPGQYADYIEGLFVMAPGSRESQPAKFCNGPQLR